MVDVTGRTRRALALFVAAVAVVVVAGLPQAASADQISDLLTKGNDGKKPPHKKALATLSADDAKAVAEFVKSLK